MVTGLAGTIKPAFGSHGMGGEITWTCLANGQYKFKMKFYRDCNGITPSSTVQMQTNVPGVPTITMNLIQQNDISPNGLQSNGVTQCADCVQGSFSNPIPGLVEEYIYESGNVTLSGVPPATGWWFRWGECCRSSALTNLSGAGSNGFANRAYMFPYNGQNANPCFDNSPYFSEKPSTIICTGFPFKYNPAAVDAELDSLVYGWANPIDDSGANLPFAPGYSLNSQLPSPTQNPLNVAATIDPHTGEMTYTSYTGGYFATVVKVTAYKCGQKVAEIYREINVVLNNNCPPVLGGIANTPPDVNPPFFDPVTGLQTAYSDTFYAGDTVSFFLNATDFEFFNNGAGQTITIEAYGNEFGAPVTNQNGGCPIVPCATLSTNTPFSFQIGGGVGFNWKLTCAHVKGLDTICTRISNTYRFVIKASDNYCPANASNVSTINITVLAPPALEAPPLRCASVNVDGSVSLSWNKPCPRDSQNIFHSYEIYAATAAAGPYILVDSVFNWNTATYTQTAANLNALFGTNAQQQSIWYYLKTRSGCDGDSISKPSDTLRTIKLNAVQNASLSIDLNWNALHVPPLSSHANKKYQIYRQYPIPSAWVLIDSTIIDSLHYVDAFSQQICDDYIAYRVDLHDSSGCVSQSSLDTVHAINAQPIVAVTPANPVICQGTCTTLTATPGAVGYSWSTGAVTQSISVCTAGTYTVTANYGACQADTSVTLVVVPLPTPNITGLSSSCGCTTLDAGAGYTSYLWSNGANTQTVNICSSGTYTVTVTNANGCTGTDTHVFNINPSPTPVITGTTSICAGQTTVLSAGGPYSTYAWSNGLTTQTITVGTGGTYTVTVTNGFGCPGSDTEVLTVHPNPVPNITGNTNVCSGFSTVFNGGGPYAIYLWNTNATTPTISTGTGGTYTVTVTDANGCTGTDTETLTVHPNPVPAITGNNAVCSGQSTIFNAGAYATYNWSTSATTPTISVNTAGTYTVTVTDVNGCVGTDTEVLTVHPNPVPNITGNNVVCNGFSTTFNAGLYSGGYSWNNGLTTQTISVNTAGTYTVTVTDGNGCTGTDTYSLTVNPNPVPNISGNPDVCAGFTTVFDGGGPYSTYLWSTNATTPTITTGTAGTYTVTVTDANGCTGTASQALTVHANPIPAITGNTVICDQQTTTFSAGAYSQYVWSNTATTPTITVGTAGTYTVTVTDVNGCVGTDTETLTVNLLPSATISGLQTICDGANTTFNIAFSGPGPYTYTYSDGSSSYGPFNTGNGSVNINVNPTTTTSYNLVSVANQNTLCVGSVAGSATVTVVPLPSAQITGTTDICNGLSTNLSVAFSGLGPWTYTYTQNGVSVGPFTTSNNPEIISVTPGLSTTYGLTPTVTGSNGCAGATNAATAVVTVNNLPTASITGNSTICAGETTDLTLTFTGTGPFNYSYTDGSVSYGPFSTSSNPATVTIAPGATSTYSLVSVSDANCTGSVAGSAAIIVNPLPTAALTGTTDICFGGNTDLQFLFTGTGPFTYSYSDGSSNYGPFTTNQNPVLVNVQPTVSTNYGPISITDANCTGTTSGSAVVSVIPLPTATLTGTTDICAGNSTNLDLTFTGVPPFEYKYTDGSTIYGLFITNNFNVTIPVTPPATTSYSITQVTGAGCGGSYTGVADITVNAIPDATLALSGNPELCFGESSEFTIGFTGVAPFTYTYTDGTTSFGPIVATGNPEIIPVTPGVTTSYSLVSIEDAHCVGTQAGTAQVIVHPLPTADATASLSICDGSSTSFNINFTGTGPYTYTYTDAGTTIGPITTNNNPEIITVAPTVNTNYAVTTVSDAYCTGSASGAVDVTVHEIPTAALSGDAEICANESTDLTIQFTGNAPFNYVYTNGVTNFGPVTSSSATTTFPVTPGITTNYTLVSLNDAYCAGTLAGSAAILVNPLPQPTIAGDLSICDGETSTLSATPGFVSYNWSNGASSTSVNTGIGGPYAVTVIDGNGCVGTSPAVNLVVNMVPVVSFTNDTSYSCETTSINFTNTSSFDPGSHFHWDFGDGFTSSLENPSHVYADSGTYQVSLSITTPATCFNETSQAVEAFFFPLPVAAFTADPWTTEVFNAKVLFTDLSENAVTWNWEFGDGDNSADKDPVHYFGDIGEFKVKLTVTNVTGCEDHVVKEIVVNPFYIPNAFTPNGDGNNEYFFDAATGYNLDVASFKITIFNRWGQSVYEADSYTKYWDGTDRNGNKVPEGVYVYKIEVTTKNSKKHLFNGTVTLLR